MWRIFISTRAGRRICLIALAALTSVAQGADGHFTVSGGKIHTPEGKLWLGAGFTGSGDNWSWAEWDHDYVDQVDLFTECWRANVLRLASRYFPTKATYDVDEAAIIDVYTPRKVVVWLQTGDNRLDESQLRELEDYWKARAVEYKDNPYVWFNISGELWGGNIDKQLWLNVNRRLIEAIRNTGARNPIVVGGNYWSQEKGTWDSNPVSESKSLFLSTGEQLKKYDGYEHENIIFCVHLYDQWENGSAEEVESNLRDFVDRNLAKGHTLFFGDIAHSGSGESNAGDLNYPEIFKAQMKVMRDYDIGGTAWHWFSGDDSDLTSSGNGAAFRIDDCDNPSNLTPHFGKKWWEFCHERDVCNREQAVSTIRSAGAGKRPPSAVAVRDKGPYTLYGANGGRILSGRHRSASSPTKSHRGAFLIHCKPDAGAIRTRDGCRVRIQPDGRR